MSEIWVNDMRVDGDPSLTHYPRMTTFEQLDEVFEVDVFRNFGWDAAQPGEMVWKLVGFNVRTGAAIFFPRVLGSDGQPFWNEPTDTGALVFHTWPGAPDFPDPSPLRPDYNSTLKQHYGDPFQTHHALANWTKKETGDADFAYGGEMASGNGAIWVSAVPEDVPKTTGAHYSDCVGGLNWIGGTDHLTASPVYQLTPKEGGVVSGLYLVNLDSAGNVTNHIPWVDGPPTQDNPALGIMHDGVVVAHVEWKAGGVG